MKSSCNFIGRIWIWTTGRLPWFESCCEEHDMAFEEGWGFQYANSVFKKCIEGRKKDTYWDELCYLGVSSFGYINYLICRIKSGGNNGKTS